MKIPGALKISGMLFTIVEEDSDTMRDFDHFADMNLRKLEIRIAKNLAPEKQENSLIHEIFEALDAIHQYHMKHETLQSLSASIYAVLKDNNLLREEVK